MRNQQWVRFSHVKARLDSEEVRALLSELCVTFGLCLPPLELERLATSPPEDSDEFTEAVFVADGDGVDRSDRVFRQAREHVAKAFLRHQGITDSD